MDGFLHRENIRRFERLLETETDPDRRATLQRLLEQEHGKDSALGSDPLDSGDQDPADA
jgi:hypothetical protein